METRTVDARLALASTESAVDGLIRGRRILIVEDETLLSLDLEAMLEDMGCTIAGRASDLQAAWAQVQEATNDAVVLDLNLHGSRAERAEALPGGRSAVGSDSLHATGAAPALSGRRLRRLWDQFVTSCSQSVFRSAVVHHRTEREAEQPIQRRGVHSVSNLLP